eukprot:10102108-Karenia_brevis.AAC.1
MGQHWQCAEALHTALADPYVISFNAAISGCEKIAQSQCALMMLESTCRAGLEHDVISFNAAILGCGTGQLWQCGVTLHTPLTDPY